MHADARLTCVKDEEVDEQTSPSPAERNHSNGGAVEIGE